MRDRQHRTKFPPFDDIYKALRPYTILYSWWGPKDILPQISIFGHYLTPKRRKNSPRAISTKMICLNFLRHSFLNLQYIMFGYDVSSCLFLNALWDSLLKICGKVYLQWEHPLDSILRQQKINPSLIIFFLFCNFVSLSFLIFCILGTYSGQRPCRPGPGAGRPED